MPIDINHVANLIEHAHQNKKPVDSLIASTDASATKLDALRVAQEVVRRRVQAGDRQVGFKLGNIAKAMQDKFGVDEPDYGPLLASQFYSENLTISETDFIEPFVELEPAFVLKRSLSGPNVNPADVISATDYIVPAIEIIDSRVKDWNIGLLDTIADGGSVGGVVMSAQPRKLSEINLSNMKGEIRYDGKVVATGNTSAIYGNPVSAIAWLVRRISEYGLSLNAGDFILPGSCLAAEKMVPGVQVTGEFEGWGEINFEYSAAN